MLPRRLPRQLKHFPTETQISFSRDSRKHRTIMRLVTSDQPGLLAVVGRAFAECGVRLQNAKIAYTHFDRPAAGFERN